MDGTGKIKFREFSCYCDSCINTKYEDCTMDMHCGNWIDAEIVPYPSYDAYETYSDGE